MERNSWLQLSSEDARYRLPADLAARDAFGARDVGWVEQMSTLLGDFSAPGDRVLDPFCGFGSTLIAAALAERVGVGIELEPERAALCRERLARLALHTPEVHCGDALRVLPTLAPVQLVLTNLPYFGCPFPGDAPPSQLYAADDYASYLERMRLWIGALVSVLAPGGHVVAAVQNVEVGGHAVPQAWDIARLLAERFTLREERVLVYERAQRPERSPARANRAHEYVLVAQHLPRAIDLDDTLACLQALTREHACVVFGSFARWLRDPTRASLPGDADLLVPNDPTQVARIAGWLTQHGFRISRWGAPLELPALASAMPDAHYLRAERLRADGRLCQLDLYFGQGTGHFRAALEASERVAELHVARDQA